MTLIVTQMEAIECPLNSSELNWCPVVRNESQTSWAVIISGSYLITVLLLVCSCGHRLRVLPLAPRFVVLLRSWIAYRRWDALNQGCTPQRSDCLKLIPVTGIELLELPGDYKPSERGVFIYIDVFILNSGAIVWTKASMKTSSFDRRRLCTVWCFVWNLK